MPNLFSDQVFPTDTIIYDGKPLTVEITGSRVLVWGDVVFGTIEEDKVKRDGIFNQEETLVTQKGRLVKVNSYFAHSLKRGASVNAVRAWPNRRLPYFFKEDVTEEMKINFRKVAAAWSVGADVDIVESSPAEVNALRVETANGCYSNVGYTDDNVIGLGKTGNPACGFTFNVVAHEMGHALGLIHEHQRSDRDEHIEFYPQKVDMDERKLKINFDIRNNSWLINDYDLTSVMHYPEFHFAKNSSQGIREPIWVPKDVNARSDLAMKEIRQRDFDAVKKVHENEVRNAPTPEPTSISIKIN